MTRATNQYKTIPLESNNIPGLVKELRDQEDILISEHIDVQIDRAIINWEGCLEFIYSYEKTPKELAEDIAWARKWKTDQIVQKRAEIAKLEADLEYL